jgi:hypothetical protein
LSSNSGLALVYAGKVLQARLASSYRIKVKDSTGRGFTNIARAKGDC